MIKKIILGVVALMVVGAGVLFAINGKDRYEADKYNLTATDGLNVGSKLDFTLPDQFDKPHSLSSDTKKLILSFSKASGHAVKEFLKKESKEFLEQHKTMFIADISPMPVVIRNTFALPDLKKSPFSVLLIYDKELANRIKPKENSDNIILVLLKDKKVTDIKVIHNIQEAF